jgi:hypothetical protein
MGAIFLVHSHQDADLASEIRADLEAAEFEVWSDDSSEVGTTAWFQDMRQIVKAVRGVVVLMSPNAATAQNVEDIIGIARLMHQPIFPVLVAGELRRAKPLGLKVENYFDLRQDYNEGIEALIESLARFFDQKEGETEEEPEDEEEEEEREETNPRWDDWREDDDDWAADDQDVFLDQQIARYRLDQDEADNT